MKQILMQYTILYAEDDKEVQKSAIEYLSKYFKKVYSASDGREALMLYDTYKPDAMMLDIDMPYVDGLSVAKYVRDGNEQIPIVMLTAFTDVDKLLKATELNLCKYLIKPVDPQDFKAVMQKLAKQLQKLSDVYVKLKEKYCWHKNKKELYVEGNRVSLTQKEQTLLSILIEKQGECVFFTDIMAVVWENDFDAEISVQSVKFQITLLRKKLPKGSIQNVYGKGYILL